MSLGSRDGVSPQHEDPARLDTGWERHAIERQGNRLPDEGLRAFRGQPCFQRVGDHVQLSTNRGLLHQPVEALQGLCFARHGTLLGIRHLSAACRPVS